MSARTVAVPGGLDKREFLKALTSFRRGDFSVRVPVGGRMERRLRRLLREADVREQIAPDEDRVFRLFFWN